MGLPTNLASIRSLYHFSLNDLPLSNLDVKHWIYLHSENSSKDGKVIRIYPYWELREIEHCLCEFDKYERIRLGQGRPRTKFNGLPPQILEGVDNEN